MFPKPLAKDGKRAIEQLPSTIFCQEERYSVKISSLHKGYIGGKMLIPYIPPTGLLAES